MNAKFIIDRPAWLDETHIYFCMDAQDGRTISALPVQLVSQPLEQEGQTIQGPMLTLRGRDTDSALQSLMDELWRNGIRPRDIGTPGHLAATQAHLADFRAIIAKQLGVTLP